MSAQQLAARLRLFNLQSLGSLSLACVWLLLVLFRACLQSLTTLKDYAGKVMRRLVQLFTGDNGLLSSKRFVGIIGAFVLFSLLVYNTMHPKQLPPSADLIAAVEWVTILTLGFTSIDKFSGKAKDE